MTRFTSAVTAALIASASFASGALAEGNYYDGASDNAALVDHTRTGSIAKDTQYGGTSTVSRGDYYDGANRPN